MNESICRLRIDSAVLLSSASMFSGNRFIDEFSLTLLSLGGINLLSKLIKQGKGINMGEALIYDAVRTPRGKGKSSGHCTP